MATRFAERDLKLLELDVLASNDRARSVYERWGFRAVELKLAAPVDGLIDRLTLVGFLAGLRSVSVPCSVNLVGSDGP